MEAETLLAKLEEMFASQQTEEVEGFLSENLKKAMEEGNTGLVLTIINELIGYYRDIGMFERMLLYCRQSLKLMEHLEMDGTNPYAKALLNAANAYRAAGMYESSLEAYEQVERIYNQILEKTDLDWAAYYNNLSLLYQEMQEHEKACCQLEKALAIVTGREDTRIKEAVSRSNLAASLLKCGRTAEAEIQVRKALELFAVDQEKDFHYSAAATAAGDLYEQKGEYKKAAQYYEEALIEQERQAGRSSGYHRILSKLQQVYENMGQKRLLSGLSLAEEYYNSYGKTMIQEQFPEYKDRIAVGLAGEGSDCLGFDDLLSRDHDFGPGFSLWVTDETYKIIGESLQNAYEALPKYLHGISRQTTRQGKNRVGVCRIGDFYHRITGYSAGPKTKSEWLKIEDWQLRTAVSGQVFYDGEGIFSGIRSRLQQGYPQEVFYLKLAEKLALAGQQGQCGYARMMSRGQVVPASMYLSQFAKSCMEIIYYLNRQYPPYEKWLWNGLGQLKILPQIQKEIEQLFLIELDQEVWKDSEVWNGLLNRRDKRVVLIEEIAAQIIEQLHQQGITRSQSTYLERHGQELMEHLQKGELNCND